MIEQKYNLNLIPDKVPVMVRASQYDALSRTIIFNVFNGSELYEIPSGATVTVRGTKEDNTGFEYSCIVNGSEVSFEIQAQMTMFYGLVPCEIRITSGTEIIGSCNFQLNIEKTPLDSSTEISETQLPLLEEAIQAAADAQQSASAAAQSASQAEEVLSTAVKSVNGELPDASGNVEIEAGGVPAGGTAGQILTKQSSTDGDADWENPLINYEITGSVPSPTPLNADQLQGHPASYFQKLLTAGSGIDISNDVISSFTRIEQVWSSEATSAFTGTVRTGITNAKGFQVYLKEKTTSTRLIATTFLGSGGITQIGLSYSSAPYILYARPISCNVEAGTISFENAYPLTAYGTYGSVDNTYAVPYKIFALY